MQVRAEIDAIGRYFQILPDREVTISPRSSAGPVYRARILRSPNTMVARSLQTQANYAHSAYQGFLSQTRRIKADNFDASEAGLNYVCEFRTSDSEIQLGLPSPPPLVSRLGEERADKITRDFPAAWSLFLI